MPEEINRVLTDHLSDLLFAPTLAAAGNLRHEGITESRIRLVGDVMFDAALFFGDAAPTSGRRVLERLGLAPKSYILGRSTAPRTPTRPSRLRAIFGGLAQVADEVPVVLPLHPRTRKALERRGLLGRMSEHVRLIDPVGYLDMVRLERGAGLVATDSGGVQKEAFFYRVPCVTLRDETEWVELVELGWNRIVRPTGAREVAEGVRAGLDTIGRSGEPYGSGDAARRIAEALCEGVPKRPESDEVVSAA